MSFQKVNLRQSEYDKLKIVSNITQTSMATLLLNALKPAFSNPVLFGVDSMTASRIKSELEKS